LRFWILGETRSYGDEKLIVCELVGENTASCCHVPVVMGAWRYKCYLEEPCLRSVLKDSMCGSNSSIGASENNDVLPGLRR
jgi:hypothetical protein